MIDAHLHLQDERLSNQRIAVIAAMRAAGINRWAVNGTSPDDWEQVRELAHNYREVIPGYGVHPWRVNSLSADWEALLLQKLEEDPDSFVGEIGLDKWIRDHNIERQKEVFIRQIEIANELNRPTEIHCLRAWGHLLECLRNHAPTRPFLLHSFAGPREMIPEFVALGGYFSISGYFFRADKAEKREGFSNIPLDRILLETDAPDMLPPDHLRAHHLEDEKSEPINHPANLEMIYEAFTEWKGLPDLETTAITMRRNFGCFLS